MKVSSASGRLIQHALPRPAPACRRREERPVGTATAGERPRQGPARGPGASALEGLEAGEAVLAAPARAVAAARAFAAGNGFLPGQIIDRCI